MDHALTASRVRFARFARFDPAALGVWCLGFGLVAYLGLRGGGYDVVVRGELGVAMWWLVLVGALAGVIPAVRPTRTEWAALAAFGGLAVWSAIAIAWSSSAERSVVEVARVVTHVGALALIVGVLRRDTARQALNGVGAAIVLVAAVGVGSRLHPAWFPTDPVPEFFGGNRQRLNYPLNYSDGLAAFVAIGLPVLLGVTASARTIAARALAAAGVPVVVLCVFLTASRGGIVALAAGVVVFYLLAPDRLPKLATGLLGGAGGAILIAAVTDRPELRDGLLGPLARSQGDEVLAFAVVVCAGVALVQVALSLVERHVERPAWALVSRRRATRIALAAAAVVLIGAVVAGAPGELSDRWQEFKRPASSAPVSDATTVFGRFGNLSGNRYQYWDVGLDAFGEKPIGGIGPGTFEFYWLQHGTVYEFVRDAHSLFVETLAELGIVGFLLLLGGFAVVLIAGVRAAAGGDPRTRSVAAAATAGVVAFMAGALLNWTWEITVIPVATMVLAAVALACARPAPRIRSATVDAPPRAPLGRAARGAVALTGLVATAALAIPLASTEAVRRSQREAGDTQLAAALREAGSAADLQPYAATPLLQQALVLEVDGAYDPAVLAIRGAIDREPQNWRLWLVLSRLEAERGRGDASVSAFQKAKRLNPGSPLFATR